jgi:ATP-binding cassette subfamily C protein
VIIDLFRGKGRRKVTPALLQMDNAECGAASLGMILRYYGKFVPLLELRVACGVSRDGSKASSVVAAARHYGLEARGMRRTPEEVVEGDLPAVVFWQFNHFLVVEGYDEEQGVVFLNDPAVGHRTVSFKHFDESFTGVALEFKPGPAFERGGAADRSMTEAVRVRLATSRDALVQCIWAGLLLVAPGIAIPAFSRIFIDDVFVAEREAWVRPVLLMMLATIALQALIKGIQLRVLRRLQVKLAASLSMDFVWRLLRLPISFYVQRFPGEISGRSALNDRVASILSGQLASTAIDAAMLVFYLGVMCVFDVKLTLMCVLLSAANVAALQFIARGRVEATLAATLEQGKASSVMMAGLQSIETLKASGLESEFFARWAGYHAKAINAEREIEVKNAAIGVLPVLVDSLMVAALLLFGSLRVIHGGMTIGTLIAFQFLVAAFLAPLKQMLNLGSTLQSLRANLLSLDDVLDQPLDGEIVAAERGTRDLPRPTPPDPKLRGLVELRGVSFGYNPLAPPIINDLHLTIKPGHHVALVGGSGSGKSTLAKIICGLYQPSAGEVAFDGVPRGGHSRDVLASSIAIVDQDIAMFAASVRDNLTLWDELGDAGAILQACKDAEILDVVRAMVGGFDALLPEGGTNLSGGQRQRLEIARALVNGPTILVLDEATSALDNVTERRIVENIRRRGCTCVVVAHRLSTIRHCDEIVVLERGQVVQRGTHDALMLEDGYYAELVRKEEGEEAA